MTTKLPVIADVLEWIKANRKGNAFKDYTDQRIVVLVYHSIYDNCFAYSLDDKGVFTGVVCGTKNATSKTVWIHDILTIKRGIVKKFMKQFNDTYPDWKIVGMCRGRLRKFNNSSKLERRLS